QGRGQGVVAVDHHLARAPKDPVLGGVVALQVGVAVHVVGAEVEHRGHLRPQVFHQLQLEARQLYHVELPAGRQEVEGGGAEVAAGTHVVAGGGGHLPHQGGDGAFAVGAGDGDDGGGGRLGEQLDVAGDGDPRLGGLLQGRLGEGDAGAHHQALGGAQ